MWKPAPGSTGRLVQLCVGYFFFYILTGIMVKEFTALREPKMSEMAYLFNNTVGGSVIALGVEVPLPVSSGACTITLVNGVAGDHELPFHCST